RFAELDGAWKLDLAQSRGLLRELRRAGDADHREAARGPRRNQSGQKRHERDGMDTVGVLVLPLYPRVQHYRATRDLGADALERTGLANRRAGGRALRRRGDPHSAGVAARTSAPVARAQAAGSRLQMSSTIKRVRALVVRGGGGDYHDQGSGHWIDDHTSPAR